MAPESLESVWNTTPLRRFANSESLPDSIPQRMTSLHAVITTIQAPTPAVIDLAARLGPLDAPLIIIGDRKGPEDYPLPGVHFMSLASQQAGPFALARLGPTGHYTRKNVGYLEAIRLGATCIYETDDDNAPLPDWRLRGVEVEAQEVLDRGWVNAYRCFSSARIWPRGLPLDELTRSFDAGVGLAPELRRVRAPIQQGLANGSPDVDAIWRLVLDAPFDFESRPSILLPPGAWCPFNSQSTWWWPEAFPLLYLPSHCSFRMTDIWRSFVAQRCLWALGHGVVFHAAEVVQDRNAHDLMRDFRDEVPGYLQNRRIADVLDALSLSSAPADTGANLLRCYEALVRAEIFSQKETDLVQVWLTDLQSSVDSGMQTGRDGVARSLSTMPSTKREPES